ncbi:MAG: hypothetical protein QOE97_3203 [Pseudonocardiales bacterium]|jgi:hypothetical protein|nr:hypothetical protein [Pseudonocardiales bacterium]
MSDRATPGLTPRGGRDVDGGGSDAPCESAVRREGTR